jgi:hypothetical protein
MDNIWGRGFTKPIFAGGFTMHSWVENKENIEGWSFQKVIFHFTDDRV